MQWIPADVNIDFMGARGKAGILSGLVVGASILVVATLGLNQGIDFKGGSAVIVALDASKDVSRADLEEAIRSLVVEETGDETTQVTVQDFDVGVTGEDEAVPAHRYLVYTEVTSLISDAKQDEIKKTIQDRFGADTRIDVPNEGTDTYYINFTKTADVSTRKGELAALFTEIGFNEFSVNSDLDRQLDVEYFEELNLILEEKEAGTSGEEADDFILSQEAWTAKKQKLMQGKNDKRYTVAVEELRAKVTTRMSEKFGDAFLRAESSTSVSPSVGRDLLNNGLLAVLYAIIGILIYITLRFDFRFAPGAVVALLHDVIITIGIFSLFQIKFSLPIIAALLTIVGYSLNDTIVVLDRVRETFDAYRGRSIEKLLNRAINETLSRTVLTSVTTLFVVISILAFGGGLIRDFALALAIGVVVGTYSSIFVACPLVYYMDQYMARRDSAKLREARGGDTNPVKATV